jgi:type IV secretion system protein VirB10
MSETPQPLEMPPPPRPRRLNRLALVAVLVLLGVAVAAVFLTLAPPRRPKGAAESAEGPGPPRPDFLEREPAGTTPAPRAVPAEDERYWQDALRAGRTPGGAGATAAAGAAGAAGVPGAPGAAGAAARDLSQVGSGPGGGSEDLLAAGIEPGAGPRPGMASAATPAPTARAAAYQRALLAPVTPARAAAEAGESFGVGVPEGMARQLGSLPASGLPPLAGLPGLPPLPPPLDLPLPSGLAAPPAPPGAAVAAGAAGAAGAAPGGGGGAAAATAATAATAGGDRRDHQGFWRSAETLAPVELRVRHDRPGAGLRLEAGTVLPAALVTAVDSDVAGPLVAQVTRDVFDRDQRQVVIPRGSRLLGAYDSQVALGESRLLVAWSRVIFPDGSGLSFPGLPAATRAGEAGLPGSVDNHLARVFGSAVLLSVLGAGVQLSQPQESAAFGAAASTRQVAAAAVGQELSSVAIEILRRQLSVPPTIRIAAGTRFYVFLRGDVRFEEPPSQE